MDTLLNPLFTAEEINHAIKRIAREIGDDYTGKLPLVIGILKGSFIFLADLVRAVAIPMEIDFIRAESYGNSDTSSGTVRISKDIDIRAHNRDVILVEDIVDTGVTLDVVLKHIRAQKPSSLRLCALVDKRIRREIPVTIDYCGFQIDDGFLVGYGLDYQEKYRYLPGIYTLVK